MNKLPELTIYKNVDYPLFDWLRIILAMIVVIVHSGMVDSPEIAVLAVHVFFALSGYLIGGILINSDIKNLAHFYFNRATRVWIPYFFAILLIYSIDVAKNGIGLSIAPSIIFDATFTHNLFVSPVIGSDSVLRLPLGGAANHVWSISVEEQFYLLSPLILVLCQGRFRAILWMIITFLAIARETQFGSICLGVAMALYLSSGDRITVPVTARLASIPIIVVSAGLLFAQATPFLVIAPFFAISIVLLCTIPGQRTAAALFFGGISYPVYLNHGIAMRLVDRLAISTGFELNWLEGLVKIGVGLAAGAIAYAVIDRTVMARRQRYFSQKRGRILGGAGYALLATGLLTGLWLRL